MHSIVVTLLATFTADHALAQATPTAPAPIVYQGVADQYKAQAQAIEAAREQYEKDRQRRREEAGERAQRDQQMMQMMQMMGGGGKGGSGRGGPRNGGAPAAAASGGSQNVATANLEPCGTPPPKVQQDFQEMMEFRKGCGAANKGAGQKFAVNSYRGSLGTPTMYLFDENGECKYKTAVAYGSGDTRGNTNPPQACADGKSHLTPAGMHLTVPHPKGQNGYDETNSLGMAALEGQGSNGRGILIHGSNSPGLGYTYGCSGVDQSCISSVMKFLGYGALVFNSFDESQAAPGCRNTSGMKRNGSCRAEVAVSASAAAPADGGRGGSAR